MCWGETIDIQGKSSFPFRYAFVGPRYHFLAPFFLTGVFVRYPNLRYGNPTEFTYYAMGVPLADLARRLRRDERTVRDWLSGRARVPWWVPEIMRLKRLEADLRHRQMFWAVPNKPPLTRLAVVAEDGTLVEPPLVKTA
jgi:hypothetical protein